MTTKSTALRSVPREQLERVAMNMRRKARNQALDSQRMKQRVMTAVVGAGAAYAMGYVMAQREFNPNQATQISGVDMELVVGGGAAILGILAQGKGGSTRKIGEFLESSGMGVLAFYAGSKGEEMGLTAAQSGPLPGA